tara:strand:- start:5116 stop:5586 length:471 start_codon:yes stop_codon:yes gene_type:complete
MKRIAVIRIRGTHNLKPKARKTLDLMNLRTKFSCVFLKDIPENIGMIKNVKDFITWGEIDKEIFAKVLSSRGRLPGNKKLTEEYLKSKVSLSFDKFCEEFMEGKKDLKSVEGLKKNFRLMPPRKGFERKGIKKQFSMGGALGYRGEKMKELLERMI